MAKTYYGHLCGFNYIDFDGSHETAAYVEPDGVNPPDVNRVPGSLGWYAECVCEPSAGLVGPFNTEAEAVLAATDQLAFIEFMMGDDPLGDFHGANQ